MESKLDGQTDNSAHLRAVQNFFIKSLKILLLLIIFDFIYFSIWFSAVFYVLNSPSSFVTVLDRFKINDNEINVIQIYSAKFDTKSLKYSCY